jgi:hypothetical protein
MPVAPSLTDLESASTLETVVRADPVTAPARTPLATMLATTTPARAAAVVALLALVVPAAAQSGGASGNGLPTIVSPVPAQGSPRELRFTLDPLTGAVHRAPGGPGAADVIYDNTCRASYFLPQPNAVQLGAPEPLASGDWGGLPNQLFPGQPGDCNPGCASTYAVDEMTIGYCTSRGLPVSLVLHFWTPPQASCFGATVIGGQVPPAVPTAKSFTLSGLPRSAAPVPVPLAACYAVTIDLGAGGFPLQGGPDFFPVSSPMPTQGDRFAWSMQMRDGNGGDGPLLAGAGPVPEGCGVCAGTIWAASPSPAVPDGVGLGQDNHLFVDSYGSATVPSDDCRQLHPGGHPWSGQYLELASDKACITAIGVAFCDGSDGSLGFCPCGNAGTANTGCDNPQGTGGVGLDVVAQQTAPTNSVTMTAFGFPMVASPAAIVMRSNMIDPNAPVVFGDGLLCIGPSPLVRLGATLASAGTSTHVFGHNSAMAGVGNFFYQVWYRSQPASFCNLLATGTRPYNASNARWLIWSQ